MSISEDSSMETLNEIADDENSSTLLIEALDGSDTMDGSFPKFIPTIKVDNDKHPPEALRFDCVIIKSALVKRISKNGKFQGRSIIIPVRVEYPAPHREIVETVSRTKLTKSFCPKVATKLRDIWLKWCIKCGTVYSGKSRCCPEMRLFCPEPKPLEVNCVITHAGCMDGRGSSWIVHRFFCKLRNHRKACSMLEIIESKHETKGETITEIVRMCAGKKVMVTDFAFPPAEILRIKESCSKFLLLDHHNSNMLSLVGEPNCYFDMEHSGAYLTWAYMVSEVPLAIPQNTEAPKLIQYIQDRDIWKFSLPNSKEISSALRIHCKNYLEDFDMIDEREDEVLSDMAHKGKLYMLAQSFNINGGNLMGVDKTTFMSVPTAVINTNESPSDVADAILSSTAYKAQRIVMVISWRPRLGLWKVNLRSRESDPDIDVGFIASEYWNGGGHPQASGFTIPTSESIETIFKRYPSHKDKTPIEYKLRKTPTTQICDTPELMKARKIRDYMSIMYVK